MPSRSQKLAGAHGAILVEDEAGRRQRHQHWEDMVRQHHS